MTEDSATPTPDEIAVAAAPDAPEAPRKGGRLSVDPILSAMVGRAVDTVVIPNDEVMNNSMVTEYWQNNTRFAGCYPNPEARKAPNLPRWFCRVHAGKGQTRYIYRGTLYQCALAADIWNIASEPFRKLHVLGHGNYKFWRPLFNLSDAIARQTYKKDTRIREYFWKILEHFEAQGIIINWSAKRRKQGEAAAKVDVHLKAGHLSSRNFALVILEAIADLRVVFFALQDQVDAVQEGQVALRKLLEGPVTYYDPTKEPAPVKVEPAPGKGAQTIRTWSDFERLEAEAEATDPTNEAGLPLPITTPAPGNTKEPGESIFG